MRSLVIVAVITAGLYGCASLPDSVTDDGAGGQSPEREDPTQQRPVLDPAEELYERIGAAVSLGRPEEAIAAYEEAEREAPDSPETQVLLGNLYLAAGDMASAEDAFSDALAMDPENGDALFGLSLIAGARGEEREERMLLEQVVEVDPSHSDARAALGEMHLQARAYNAAEDAFTTALESNPDHFVALIGLGNVKLRTEEPEQAEEALSRAIEIAPEFSFAYADRSRARAMQYELAAAEEDLDTAIELESDYPWHRYDRGLVRLERNDFTGAVDDFSSFIEVRPDIFMAYVHRARGYMAIENVPAAIEDYESALALRPDFHPALEPYGMLALASGDFATAARSFTRARRSAAPADPVDPRLILLTALSWKLNGDDGRAAEVLEENARDLPQDSLYYEMARYFTRSASGRAGDDGRILRAVENEQDRSLQLFMKFLLAGQYEADRRIHSARALYREVADNELRGAPEKLPARRRYATLTDAP